jgi:uncharacterized membrane protein
MSKIQATGPQEPVKSGDLLNLDRLIFLVDGVFAITLTLLILDLKLSDQGARPLGESLKLLLPRLAIYLYAFASISNQWIIHHRTFRWVQHSDSTLVILSLVNLLFITLIPASTALVGAYPSERLAAACSGVNSLLLCLSGAAVWRYVAVHGNLLADEADPRVLNGISIVWSLVAISFVVGLLVGQISVYAEYAVWVLWSPIVTIWCNRRRRRLEPLPVPERSVRSRPARL